jgi:hypothetical protein
MAMAGFSGHTVIIQCLYLQVDGSVICEKSMELERKA